MQATGRREVLMVSLHMHFRNKAKAIGEARKYYGFFLCAFDSGDMNMVIVRIVEGYPWPASRSNA
jgi:hypothetical protein